MTYICTIINGNTVFMINKNAKNRMLPRSYKLDPNQLKTQCFNTWL